MQQNHVRICLFGSSKRFPLEFVVTRPFEAQYCIQIFGDDPRVTELRRLSDDQLQSPAQSVDGDKI